MCSATQVPWRNFRFFYNLSSSALSRMEVVITCISTDLSESKIIKKWPGLFFFILAFLFSFSNVGVISAFNHFPHHTHCGYGIVPTLRTVDTCGLRCCVVGRYPNHVGLRRRVQKGICITFCVTQIELGADCFRPYHTRVEQNCMVDCSLE